MLTGHQRIAITRRFPGATFRIQGTHEIINIAFTEGRVSAIAVTGSGNWAVIPSVQDHENYDCPEFVQAARDLERILFHPPPAQPSQAGYPYQGPRFRRPRRPASCSTSV